MSGLRGRLPGEGHADDCFALRIQDTRHGPRLGDCGDGRGHLFHLGGLCKAVGSLGHETAQARIPAAGASRIRTAPPDAVGVEIGQNQARNSKRNQSGADALTIVPVPVAGRSGSSIPRTVPSSAPVRGCESPASCSSLGCIAFSASTHGTASRDGDEGVVFIFCGWSRCGCPLRAHSSQEPSAGIAQLARPTERIGSTGWQTLEHAARTAVTAVASMLAAGFLRLQQTYWARITIMVIKAQVALRPRGGLACWLRRSTESRGSYE